MNLWRYWPLAILLLGLAGCRGSSDGSTVTGKSAAESIESGNAALARGELDQALADFNAALEAEPDSAVAHERRAAAYLHKKKFESAMNDCNSALRIDGKLAAAYFTRGQVEWRLQDLQKAKADFTKALDNGLVRGDVLTARGVLYHSLAKASLKPEEAMKILENALKDLDRAVKLDPRQVECRVQRAAIRVDMRDYENAADDCNEALKVDPNLAAAYVLRARCECELSEFDAAKTDCESAIHLDEKLFEAYVLRAKARLEKSSQMRTLDEVAQCDRAVDDCQQTIERAKKYQGDAEGARHAKRMRGLAHELRGSIYQGLKAGEKALGEYEQALALDPFLVSALVRRAVTRTNEADFAGALNDCNQAIGIDSVRPEAYNGRGWIYALKQDFQNAVVDFTLAVSLDKNCAEAYSRRALVYSTMASQELTAAASMRRPSNREEYAAHLQKMQEYWQKAIDDAGKAIEHNRHLARAYLTRAAVYGRQRLYRERFYFGQQQDPRKVLADFGAAIREDPAMAPAYFNRAVYLANLGQLDAAAKDFQAAATLQPNNPGIYERLFLIHKAKNDEIMMAKYKLLWQEKLNSRRASLEQDLENLDFAAKRKPEAEPQPDLKPDSELEPIEKAKIELGKKLDATAEK